MNKIKLIALCFTLSLAALLLTLFVNERGNPKPTEKVLAQPNTAKSEAPVKDTESSGYSYHWKKDLSGVYQFHYHIKSFSQTSPDAEEMSIVDLKTSGELQVRVLKADEDTVLLGMQVHNGKILMHDGAEQPVEVPWITGLFITHMTPSGEIKKITISEEMPEDSIHFITQQFGIQIILPEDGCVAEKQWTVPENDAVGKYLADYIALSSTELKKNKVEYFEIEKQDLEKFKILQATTEATLGKFWLEEYVKKETWEYPVPESEGRIISEETVKFKLNALQHLEPTLLISQLDTNLPLSDLLNRVQGQEIPLPKEAEIQELARQSEQEIAEEKYQGVPFEVVFDELAKVVEEAEDHAVTVDSILNLKQWYMANPEAMQTAYEMLGVGGKDISDELSARMIHALELVPESEEAQATIAMILDDPELEWTKRLQAAVAAGGVDSIHSQELEDALWKAAFNPTNSEDVQEMQVSDSSLYALGILASNNEQLATDLEANLIGQLAADSAVDPEDLNVSLRTLTNAKIYTEETLQQAATLIKEHSDAGVKITAIEYLNQDKDNRYTSTIVDALKDQNRDVRVAAARELKNVQSQADSVVDSLIMHLKSETEPVVKAEVILALGDHAKTNSKARNHLYLEKVNTSADLLPIIEQALQQ